MILKANEDSWIAALHKDSAHIPSSWLSCYLLKPLHSRTLLTQEWKLRDY